MNLHISPKGAVEIYEYLFGAVITPPTSFTPEQFAECMALAMQYKAIGEYFREYRASGYYWFARIGNTFHITHNSTVVDEIPFSFTGQNAGVAVQLAFVLAAISRQLAEIHIHLMLEELREAKKEVRFDASVPA